MHQQQRQDPHITPSNPAPDAEVTAPKLTGPELTSPKLTSPDVAPDAQESCLAGPDGDGRTTALFTAALEGDRRAAAQLRAIAADVTAPDTNHAADALGALAVSDALAVERLLEDEPELHAAARTADADQTAAAVLAALSRAAVPPGGPQPGGPQPGGPQSDAAAPGPYRPGVPEEDPASRSAPGSAPGSTSP